MASNDPPKWADQFVGACIGVLVGSLALYGAVLVIQHIWVWLCVSLLTGSGIACLVWWLRRRAGRW